ncbi:oligosaccharide flippase family protein [Bacillus megaterium]|nr:oligosaccharide flippase family protein [Priestia megaterium]
MSFGLFVSGKEFLNFLGKYFDEIIVGRILNVEILGYYYVAKQLIEKSVTLISSNVNKVFYPLYSELVKRKMVINHLSHNTF